VLASALLLAIAVNNVVSHENCLEERVGFREFNAQSISEHRFYAGQMVPNDFDKVCLHLRVQTFPRFEHAAWVGAHLTEVFGLSVAPGSPSARRAKSSSHRSHRSYAKKVLRLLDRACKLSKSLPNSHRFASRDSCPFSKTSRMARFTMAR